VSQDKRHELVAEILHAARVLGSAGFLPATDGNLSARLDERLILITVRGVEKRELREAHIVEVSVDGLRPAEGSTEWPMHSALYRHRPDVHCVLHVHSPALTAFATAHRVPRIELLAEAYATVGRMALVPFVKPGTPLVGETMLKTDSTAMVYLLANHGAVAVGGTVRETLHRLERAEFLAQVELNAAAVGGGHSPTRDQLTALK